jgi:hypothetical protein
MGDKSNPTILHLDLKTIKNVSPPCWENHPSVMFDALPQGSTNADPLAFAQQPTQGSNSSTIYLLQACHNNPLSTAARKLHADNLDSTLDKLIFAHHSHLACPTHV